MSYLSASCFVGCINKCFQKHLYTSTTTLYFVWSNELSFHGPQFLKGDRFSRKVLCTVGFAGEWHSVSFHAYIVIILDMESRL